MPKLSELYTVLSIRDSEFRKGLARTKRGLDAHQRQLEIIGKRYNRWRGQMNQAARELTSLRTVALGLGAAAGGLGLALTSAARRAEELTRAAQATGLSLREFERFRVSWQRFGLDVDASRDAISDFQQEISEFISRDSGPIKDFADLLGKDVVGALKTAQSEAERLHVLFEGLAALPQSAQRFVISRFVEGADLQAVVRYFRQGPASIAQQAASDERRGAYQLEAIGRQAEDLSNSFKTFSDVLANQFTGAIVSNTDVSESLLQRLEGFTARLASVSGSLVDVATRNPEATAEAVRRVIQASGALGFGLPIGQLSTQLAIAREQGLQAQRRAELQQVTALNRSALAIERATRALEVQTANVTRAASGFRSFGRGLVASAGSFAALELAAQGLIYAFNKLSSPEPGSVSGLVETLRQAQGLPATDSTRTYRLAQALQDLRLFSQTTNARILELERERERLRATPTSARGTRAGGGRGGEASVTERIARLDAELDRLRESSKAAADGLTGYTKRLEEARNAEADALQRAEDKAKRNASIATAVEGVRERVSARDRAVLDAQNNQRRLLRDEGLSLDADNRRLALNRSLLLATDEQRAADTARFQVMERYIAEQERLNAVLGDSLRLYREFPTAELERQIESHIAEAEALGKNAAAWRRVAEARARAGAQGVKLAQKQERLDDVVNTVTDSLGNAVVGLRSFEDALKSIGASLASNVLDFLVKDILLPGIGRRFGIPGLQYGGVAQAGRAYVVGERRPELFVPNTSGYVYPSVPASSGQAVNITFQINGGDEASVRRTVNEMLPQIESRGADIAKNVTSRDLSRTSNLTRQVRGLAR